MKTKIAMNPSPSPYRTTLEAAEYLRISYRMLENWRMTGTGPRYSKFGRRVVYKDCDLDAWREQHVTTRPKPAA